MQANPPPPINLFISRNVKKKKREIAWNNARLIAVQNLNTNPLCECARWRIRITLWCIWICKCPSIQKSLASCYYAIPAVAVRGWNDVGGRRMTEGRLQTHAGDTFSEFERFQAAGDWVHGFLKPGFSQRLGYFSVGIISTQSRCSSSIWSKL